MNTARMIYISIAALTIIPFVLFNIKNFTIRKEGQAPKPNFIRILSVSVGSLFLGIFIFTLYRFTLGYQTQLVLERFVRSYSGAVMGKIEYQDFLDQTKDICTPGFQSLNDRCYTEIETDRPLNPEVINFQLGENILPKYYVEESFFPYTEGVNKEDSEPIFMLAMMDYGGTRKFYISLMYLKDNKWYINSFEKVSEELVEYAYRYKLIRSEYSNKWYKVK